MYFKTFYRKNKVLLLQSGKYLVTGGASFAADFAVYWLMEALVLQFIQYQTLRIQLATYIGLFTGLCVNYIMSKFWVFENKIRMNKKELLWFAGFTAFGFAFTGFNMWLGVAIFKLNDKLCKFVVSVLVFVINFLARKFIIFK